MELFKLLGTIAIDNAEAKKKLKETSEEGEKAESKLSKLGAGAAKAGKVIATGLAAGAGAVATLGGFAIKAYAEYEQFAGGAKLLFGDAYGYVEEQAKNAYKTVQMSTNDYLQQVNGFSTGLKTALDGDAQAAAELAHKIVVAEADIVAATGNSAENVQNAFNGIMKSNFTMLDNLQLGITPTKEGFQEVINKVNEWNTANGEATKYQIDNLADCQSALIDYIEMQGLSGYATKEAAGTIQGSLAMTKGAWENLLTGLSDPSADLSSLINNVFESVTTLAGNLIPRITEVLKGIATSIKTLVPMLAAELPNLFNQLLPPLIEGASALIEGLVSALPSVFSALISALPMIIDAVVQLGDSLVGALPQIIDMLVAALPTLIPALIDGVVSMVMAIVEQLPTIIQALIDALPTVITTIVEALVANLPILISGAVQLIGALCAALPQMFTALIDTVGMLFMSMIDGIKNLFAPITEWFSNMWNSLGSVPGLAQLKTMIEQVFVAIKNFFVTYFTAVKNVFTTAWNSIKTVVSTVINSIKNVISTAFEAIKTIISNVMKLISSVLKGDWEGVKTAISNILNAIKSVIQSVWDGIKNTISSVLNGIKNTVSSVFNGIKTVISSYLNTIKTVVSSIWNGIKGAISGALGGIKTTVTTGFGEVVSFIKGLPGKVASVGMDIVKGIGNGITNGLGWIKGKIKSWVGDVTKFIKKLFGIKSPSTVMRDEVGRYLAEGVAEGITANTEKVETASDKMAQNVLDAAQKRLDDYKVYNELTLADEIGYWDAVRLQVTAGTDARIEADKKYFEAKKAFDEALIKEEEETQKKLDEIAKRIQDRINSIMSSLKLFSGVSDEYDMQSMVNRSPVTDIINSLKNDVDTIEDWQRQIERLANKIGGTRLFDEIYGMGFDALPHIRAINAMTEKELSAYVALYDKKYGLAEGITAKEFEGIEWNAKAMNAPRILESPTIFGYNSATGKLMGGGEAGSEMIGGTNTVKGMIQDAVSRENSVLESVLYKILQALLTLDANMGGHLREALENVSLDVNKREFARLVKAVN